MSQEIAFTSQVPFEAGQSIVYRAVEVPLVKVLKFFGLRS